MADSSPPALKEWFNADRFRHVARELSALDPRFDSTTFLRRGIDGLEGLSLMQRLRRMTECLREALPGDYRETLGVLRGLAPRINHSFVTLVLPDYVGLYGRDDFAASMDALEYFTRFGSAEFAVREFLRLDLPRTLGAMERWSRSADEAVRRLASEGCRPRLPWSFHLEALIADPSPVAPILENLKTDPSLYVRKSVANHLNDITKDHPQWVLDRIQGWPQDHPHTQWIVKRALRTLVKRGHRAALAAIGAGQAPRVAVSELRAQPRKLRLGQTLTLSAQIRSRGSRPQRLVVDYRIHYVKKSGGASAKVFKWKELTLEPGASADLSRRQTIRDFTTRVHYPGRHRVELLVNGRTLAASWFQLVARS